MNRKQALRAFKILGLLVLVGLVLSRLEPQDIQRSWRGMSPQAGLAMALCFSTAMFVRVLKWGLQLRALGFNFRWSPLARNYLMALLLGVVTPMRVGELYRLAALNIPEEELLAGRLKAGAAVLIEKGYELGALLMVMLSGALVVGVPPAALALIAGGLLAVLAVVLLPLRPPAFMVPLLPGFLKTKVIAPIMLARDGAPLALRVALIGLSGTAYGLNMLGGLQLYRLFGDMGAWDFFLRLPVLTLINNLPVTIGGFGLRELSSMEVFGAMGYPASSAALAATLLFLGANVLPTLWVLPLELAASLGSDAQ